MIKVKIKTLSLLYNAQEDRMKLIINKDEGDRIDFWITRRFYFSLLFELETFLEQLDITQKIKETKKQRSDIKKNEKLKKISNSNITLLENINIRFIKESENFVFVFHSTTSEAKSIFDLKGFLNFYDILKSSFPKGEWGII